MRTDFESSRSAEASSASSGFSLLEVIFALGLFAVGIVVVLGFFPVAVKSVESNVQANAAAAVAETVAARLRSGSWDETAARLISPDSLPTVDAGPARDSRILIASVTGNIVAPESDPLWIGQESRKVFEIACVRDEALSPADHDPTAAWLVFTMRIRWPLHPLSGEAAASGAGFAENPQTLFVTGSVRR